MAFECWRKPTAVSRHPFWIPEEAPHESFPDVELALTHPNGLLAVGGDLHPKRLLCAYRRGIFPWYSEGQPILWWSPDPRSVLRPDTFVPSRSLRKTLRRGVFSIRVDTEFTTVIRACAAPRRGQPETWITSAMIDAYCELHDLGFARSIECWSEDEIVGGLYGISIGRVFFGESMFSLVSDASKVALSHLCKMGYAFIDCQLPSAHLTSLGAFDMPRRDFTAQLEALCERRLQAVAPSRESDAR